MISKLKHWKKGKYQMMQYMHHYLYFVSYISPISTYVIDPSAQLKEGRALKGREQEQKESNKIKVEILLEIKFKKNLNKI